MECRNMYSVSIIMPCKNSENTILHAIDSVRYQTYNDWELIIVDDGSEDLTLEICKNSAKHDPRIKILRNSVLNHGPAGARNVGIKQACGRFIAFLDSDDSWNVNSLERRLELIAKTGAKIVFGPYYRLLPSGKKNLVAVKHRINYSDMLTRNHIGNLTGLYDASLLGKEYQEDIRHEDYPMWCRLIERAGYAISVSGDGLGIYRVSESSLSSNKLHAFCWHWRVLRDKLHLGLFNAAIYQMKYTIYAIKIRLLDKFLHESLYKKKENN